MNANVYETVQSWNLGAKLKALMPAFFAVAFGLFALVEPSYAGLQKGTDAITKIKDWAYLILGTGIFIYLIYLIVMALMNKGSWADVLMGVVYSAVAGGVLVLGDWAWSVFK